MIISQLFFFPFTFVIARANNWVTLDSPFWIDHSLFASSLNASLKHLKDGDRNEDENYTVAIDKTRTFAVRIVCSNVGGILLIKEGNWLRKATLYTWSIFLFSSHLHPIKGQCISALVCTELNNRQQQLNLQHWIKRKDCHWQLCWPILVFLSLASIDRML